MILIISEDNFTRRLFFELNGGAQQKPETFGFFLFYFPYLQKQAKQGIVKRVTPAALACADGYREVVVLKKNDNQVTGWTINLKS
ncbi:hypothetical protein [Muriicola sp.]|uniref:hypothetical protein n=1 Tax=Muriicola sp. TaxID=2020856 RepID=UPI003C7773C5